VFILEEVTGAFFASVLSKEVSGVLKLAEEVDGCPTAMSRNVNLITLILYHMSNNMSRAVMGIFAVLGLK